MTDFSNKLKQLRESKGWSKTNVAKHLGVRLSTYANWEYGISEPDIETINQIATLYDVSNGYLMGNNNNGKEENETKSVDLEKDPVVLSYGGRPVSDEDMDVIKAILERHKNDGDIHYE
ncbi:helix-turn-helix domain-containing protein [Lactobacillus gasseri]|uniref:helix-turn-helix domain-containing protein n=1 Tax=Lactobacillus gasseri TaxID=1596 RepID=UPI002108E2B6|nr:helix-turn-helix transcriptional regulator [Lactobacillus gasseri]MCQ5247084.1 helix-turn-helix domain-containing protein [Lactobacillus gasseri]WEA88950.1 helix-turn-helix transcriptional regulator [Lactobacillus gasseri]